MSSSLGPYDARVARRPRARSGRVGTGVPVRWTVAGCVLGAGVVAASLQLSSGFGLLVPAALLGLAVVALLLVVPVHVLPTVALATAVGVSDRLADYSLAPVPAPASAVLVIWWLRRQLTGAREAAAGAGPAVPLLPSLLVPALLLAGWTLPLILVSTSPRLGTSWTLTYAVSVVAPLLVRDTARETALLQRWLPGIGAVAAGYAVVESLVGRNFLFAPLLRAVGSTNGQHWAVYRSESSFGHPLVAGLFFAVVLVLCAGRFLETRRLRFLLLGAVLALGLVTTVSRGAYLAAGVGVVALALLTIAVGHRLSRLRLASLLAGFGVLGVLALHSGAYVARGSSDEAASSVVARSNIDLIARNTARAGHYLGAGPANSLAAAAPYNFQGLPLENSFDQLLVSLGLPGLLLFCGVLAAAVVLAVRRGNLAVAAALVTFVVSCAGFAALDTRRDLLVLLGVLLMLCQQQRGRRADLSAQTAAGSRALGKPRRRRHPARWT